MTEWFQIVVLALIQGITEFLPVSSSGHLVLLPTLTGQPYQGRAIDVAAHVGTFFAVAWYTRHELIAMTRALVTGGRTNADAFRMIWLLAVATVPVVVIGFVVNKLDPAWLLDIRTLAIANLIFAGLLWASDRHGGLGKQLADMRYGTALFIGLAQIGALIPGASRSGVTMTAARWLGFDRVSAARFSLLLSLPVIAGAGLLKGLDIAEAGDSALGIDAALVALLSGVVALLAIRWMMRWLAHASFTIFVVYRLILGLALLAAISTGAISTPML